MYNFDVTSAAANFPSSGTNGRTITFSFSASFTAGLAHYILLDSGKEAYALRLSRRGWLLYTRHINVQPLAWKMPLAFDSFLTVLAIMTCNNWFLYNSGVAVGTEFCNQESLAVTSTTFWSFTTGMHNITASIIIMSYGVVIQAVLLDLRTVEELVLVSSSRSRNCRQTLWNLSFNFLPHTDINECTRGTFTCPTNAVCMNTIGSYTCPCAAGYEMSGSSCIGTVWKLLLYYCTGSNRYGWANLA